MIRATKKVKWGWVGAWLGGGSTLDRVVRESLSEEEAFEQRPEQSEGIHYYKVWEERQWEQHVQSPWGGNEPGEFRKLKDRSEDRQDQRHLSLFSVRPHLTGRDNASDQQGWQTSPWAQSYDGRGERAGQCGGGSRRAQARPQGRISETQFAKNQLVKRLTLWNLICKITNFPSLVHLPIYQKLTWRTIFHIFDKWVCSWIFFLWYI